MQKVMQKWKDAKIMQKLKDGRNGAEIEGCKK